MGAQRVTCPFSGPQMRPALVIAFRQTATPVAQTTQPQATPDQKTLPPIRVSGNRPKHRGKVRNPYRGAEAPSAPNPVPTPLVPGNVAGSNPSALAGIPITPLNAVAQSAGRLGLPVIQTPASVDVVTAQTIQDQGYRTTTDTAQGAVGASYPVTLAGRLPISRCVDSASARSTRSIMVFGPVLPTLLRDGWARPISARSPASLITTPRGLTLLSHQTRIAPTTSR